MFAGGKDMGEDIKKCCDIDHRIANVDMSLIPEENSLCDLAEFFKVFADVTRIKILYVLKQGEMSVCDIWQALGLTQSAVSHQLRTLKQMKLVKYRKEGKAVYYSLADNHILSILSQGYEHIME